MANYPKNVHRGRPETCNDPVVGAILSGWRYDISGISPELRLDYEAHLHDCVHCKGRQRRHRIIDVLLLASFSLSFVAFLLAALLIHRLDALSHILSVHVPLHNDGWAAHVRLPDSISISIQAVSIVGVVVSMLLWTLVAIATPIPAMVSSLFRERISPELRERMRKQTA
jgi:hypothetical protein